MNSFDLLDNGYIRINAPMGVVRALASLWERHPDAATVDLAQHPESPATVIPVVTETPCGQFWVEMQDGHPVLFTVCLNEMDRAL